MSPGEEIPRLNGEWTIRNSDELKRRCGALLGEAPAALDLAGVCRCDAAALQVLCSLHKTAAQNGQLLQTRVLSPAIEAMAAALGVPTASLTGNPPPGDCGRGA